jgi:hypothetical protein
MTTITTASLNLLPLTTVSAASTYLSLTMDVRHFEELMLALQVTSVTGTTPTLNVFIDTTTDSGTTWYQLAQLGPVNIAAVPVQNPYPSTYRLTISAYQSASGAFGEFIRIRYVLAGTTPSATLSVLAIGKGH